MATSATTRLEPLPASPVELGGIEARESATGYGGAVAVQRVAKAIELRGCV